MLVQRFEPRSVKVVGLTKTAKIAHSGNVVHAADHGTRATVKRVKMANLGSGLSETTTNPRILTYELSPGSLIPNFRAHEQTERMSRGSAIGESRDSLYSDV